MEEKKETEVKKEKIKAMKKVKEEEETKFKPVTKVEEKKKNHIILKTILIIVIIALILFIIHFIRNYIILDSILAKQEDLKQATNYSFKMNCVNKNATMEYYYKDNVIVIVKDLDTGKAVIWSNKEKKETIYLNSKDLSAVVNKKKVVDFFYNLMPKGLIFNSEVSRGIGFQYWITSEMVNGRDCYKVTWIFGEEAAWYDKENGTILKRTTGGQKEDYVTEYSDWKFNQLTDEDMSRPNLIGYKVTTNQDNNENNQNS